MNIADVVTLARAGFTADQIARMYATPAPVAQVAPAPVAQVAPAPVAQVAPTPVAQVAPTPVAQVAPAPVAQVAPTPVAQVAPTPVAQVAPAPVAQVAPTPDNNPVMEQLKMLTATLQANAILNSNQPKQETVDDILASIINPTK